MLVPRGLFLPCYALISVSSPLSAGGSDAIHSPSLSTSVYMEFLAVTCPLEYFGEVQFLSGAAVNAIEGRRQTW